VTSSSQRSSNGSLTPSESCLMDARCARWWPDIVTEFLARLEEPCHPHWGKDRDRYARLPAQPPEVADRRQLCRLLLDAPEALSDEGADFCVAAGIGFIHEPILAWKAAGTDKRA
jgi:hypothetical protein